MFTTNNEVLVNNWNHEPTIMCVQNSVPKSIVTEDNLRESNKKAFGSKVGAITNRVTSMYDLISLFTLGSKEYDVLKYRINCGMLYQQMDIDAVKGAIANPMPKHWYSPIKPKDDAELTEEDEFNNRICADKKPYFMRYIYPDVDKKYRSFTKAAERQCRVMFGMKIENLVKQDELTDEQASWLEWYNRLFPVNDNGSTMNRLCHMVEDEFKGFKTKVKASCEFDYKILKSNARFDPEIAKKINELYVQFSKAKARLIMDKNEVRISGDEYTESFRDITQQFKEKAYEICSNSKMLCDIIIEICYTTEKSKSFAWEVCGDQIIENLLEKNNHELSYITRDDNGDIEYNGLKFSERKCKVDNP